MAVRNGQSGKKEPSDSSHILGIIPARGGSVSIPRKNLVPLCGRPLIAYTCVAAKQSRWLSRTIVSTDDPEIASVAKEWGVEVPFLRPAELALDATPSLPVVQHAIQAIESNGYAVEYVVLLPPTSPLRSTEDIDGAVEKLVTTGADGVLSVVESDHHHHPVRAKRVINDRLCDYQFPEKEGVRRQDLPVAYFRNSAIYAVRRETVMEQQSLWGKDCRAYIMPRERSIDIDDWLDLRLAEILLSERGRASDLRSPFPKIERPF